MASKPATDPVYDLKKAPKGPIKFNLTLTELQKTVVDFIESNKISIITADPGCAKSTIAVHYALTKYRKKDYEKIIITKPTVEIGSPLGFLPGTPEEKVEQYVASYLDIMHKIVGVEETERLFSKELVEFKPIQFVRGSTMENSVIIFDEAQGCTLHEIISFVTRMSDSSKLIILTDPFQADIKHTGIHDFLTIMEDIEGVGIKELGEDFQMRSKLIQTIYGKYKKFVQK